MKDQVRPAPFYTRPPCLNVKFGYKRGGAGDIIRDAWLMVVAIHVLKLSLLTTTSQYLNKEVTSYKCQNSCNATQIPWAIL